MPSPPPKPAPRSFVINPEADKRLGRIALSYGVGVFALLVLTTFAVPYANSLYPHMPLVPKALLNGLSLVVVLVPFYFGIHKLYEARLEIGRERVSARAWTEAVAALEPFAAPMQRFLDGTGEAHYLLGQAYAGAGDKARAEKARVFVRRKTGSPWAEKLQPGRGPGISRTTAKANAKVYDAPADGSEKRPIPPKTKPRRRF